VASWRCESPAAMRAKRSSDLRRVYSVLCVDFSIDPIMGAKYNAPKFGTDDPVRFEIPDERTQMVQPQPPFSVITCKREVTVRQVRYLLCAALEGGSNYWLVIKRRYFAPGITYEDFREGGKFQTPDDYFHPDELIPTVDYCGLIVTTNEDDEEKEYDLNVSTLRDGLQSMADKQPRHWEDFIEENEDAGTGDVFLQLCLFNEVVYG
jgi:hypothetical protein